FGTELKLAPVLETGLGFGLCLGLELSLGLGLGLGLELGLGLGLVYLGTGLGPGTCIGPRTGLGLELDCVWLCNWVRAWAWNWVWAWNWAGLGTGSDLELCWAWDWFAMNLILDDSSDEDSPRRRQRVFKERINMNFEKYFEFNQRFRMTPEKLQALLDEIAQFLMKPTMRGRII
ncbi:hypothetical protein C0J52_24474, partial [Blattella germanica]